MRKNNKQWYSVIIAMLLIGFLLVLTVWVLNLVLKEMNDNRAMWDSMKAFAGAETGKELALLKIKEKWYGVDYVTNVSVSNESKNILADSWDFKKNRDVEVTYNINLLPEKDSYWKYSYSYDLWPGEYSIIPLFYEYAGESIENTEYISLQAWADIVWNLLSGNSGIAWLWGSDVWKWKEVNANAESSIVSKTISDFLHEHNDVYLILNNTSTTPQEFRLSSNDKFSKPITHIISSGQVGEYRHNIKTKFDNTKFLNMLKYAIFSD